MTASVSGKTKREHIAAFSFAPSEERDEDTYGLSNPSEARSFCSDFVRDTLFYKALMFTLAGGAFFLLRHAFRWVFKGK